MNFLSPKTNSFWLLSISYIFLMLALVPVSGNNPRSRLALEASMCEGIIQKQITYSINLQQSQNPSWTIDWAQTPDGNYYSNKAPGPSFLALLTHCPVYWAASSVYKSPQERIASHFKHLYFVEILNSFFLQIVPLLVFVFFVLNREKVKNPPRASFFILSMLFGTTASIYMNSWFGHAFAALCFTFSLWAFSKKSYVSLGFFWALALLSDYAVAVTFPVILLLLLILERKASFLKWTQIFLRITIGAAPFAILWIHYHSSNFGSAFSLPQKFQNPLFLDHPEAQGSLRAVFGSLPNPLALWELLFGFKRGILITQPWIFFVIAFSFLNWKRFSQTLKASMLFVVLSFLGLLLMNATFGQWHAGSAAGPRYLSVSLLPFGLLSFWIWELLEQRQKTLLFLFLIPSIALFVFSHSTSIIPQPDPLWPALRNIALEKKGTFFLRLGLCLFFLIPGIYLGVKRFKNFSKF